MSAFKRLMIAIVVVGVPLIGIAVWLAGFLGGLIALLVLGAGGLRFAVSLGIFSISATTSGWTSAVVVVGMVAISSIWGLNYYETRQEEEKKAAQARTAKVKATPEPEGREFALYVGQRKFTVWTEPGFCHRLWSNKPFMVASGPYDDPRKEKIPAGPSSRRTTGKGFLTLEGIESDTIVRIWTDRGSQGCLQ